MFSSETLHLQTKMLDDSQNPTEHDSLNNFIAYALSAIKELDQRLECLEKDRT